MLLEKMTIKEAVLKSLEDIPEPTHYKEILKNIQKNNYYDFSDSKTSDLTRGNITESTQVSKFDSDVNPSIYN